MNASARLTEDVIKDLVRRNNLTISEQMTLSKYVNKDATRTLMEAIHIDMGIKKCPWTVAESLALSTTPQYQLAYDGTALFTFPQPADRSLKGTEAAIQDAWRKLALEERASTPWLDSVLWGLVEQYKKLYRTSPIKCMTTRGHAVLRVDALGCKIANMLPK